MKKPPPARDDPEHRHSAQGLEIDSVMKKMFLKTVRVIPRRTIRREKIKMGGNENTLQKENSSSSRHSGSEKADRGKKDRMIFISATPCVCYAVAAFLFPQIERTFHSLVIILLMLAASWVDIREKQIPLTCLLGVFVINTFHSLFFSGGLTAWAVGFLFSALLMVVRLIKKDAIGMGDILLLGVLISALEVENILMFLFLSFLCSSVVGILLLLVKRDVKSTMVPMAPCMTIAFIAGTIIRWH